MKNEWFLTGKTQRLWKRYSFALTQSAGNSPDGRIKSRSGGAHTAKTAGDLKTSLSGSGSSHDNKWVAQLINSHSRRSKKR